MKLRLLIGLHELLCNSHSFERRWHGWCGVVSAQFWLVWQEKFFYFKLHDFLSMHTQYYTGTYCIYSSISSTCKTLKPGYPWQASEYLTGQASSTYSCLIPVTAGSYCCDNAVILMEGNRGNLTDTQTKWCFLQELSNESAWIRMSTRLSDGYEGVKTLCTSFGTIFLRHGLIRELYYTASSTWEGLLCSLDLIYFLIYRQLNITWSYGIHCTATCSL